jgi:hypothetical protein
MLAPRRVKLLLLPSHLGLGSIQQIFELSAIGPQHVDLGPEPLDFRLELGPVLSRLRGFQALREPRFEGRRVRDQPLGDIEAQQRFDGRPEHLAAGLVLGERANLLRVEEEELRDLQGEEVLDELAPMLGVPAIGLAIQRDLKLLAHLPPLHAPGPAHVVNVLLAARRMTKDDGDPRPLDSACSMVDRLPEELLIREIAPFRASRAGAVERKLDGVEHRRLPGAVGAAEEDDRPHDGTPRPGRRRQVEGLFAAVKAEVPQRRAFEDHLGRSDMARASLARSSR